MNNIIPKNQKDCNKRSSNLELYRVICMLSIVAHHFVANSGLTSLGSPMELEPNNIKSLYLWGLGMWGKTGINCFLMITGYFMCTSKITVRKFLKLILQIYFYKISIYSIFLCTGYESFTFEKFIKLVSPFWGLNQNFIGCFIVFWLTIPFWNILIKNLTQRNHLFLLALLLTCYSILGSIPTFKISFNYVTWFGIIYLTSSYIRLHPHHIFSNRRIWGIVCILTILLALTSMYILSTELNVKQPIFFVHDSNKIFATIIAISSFIWFLNLKISYNKTINIIGGSTFGVLLIHANSDAMRQWLWKDLINVIGMYELPIMQLVFYSLGTIIIVFSSCTLIDIIRSTYLEKKLFKWYDNNMKTK